MKPFSDGVKTGLEWMGIAARTAPKAGGKDYVEIRILDEEETQALGKAMIAYGEKTQKKNFDRDGENVLKSMGVLLLSLNKPQTAGLNCGACGKSQCSQLSLEHDGEFAGPLCAWRLLDLGIALGSAAKTASLLNLDNRMMYRIGVSAREMGLIEGELVVGIPVSATGKNIFFDR